MESKHVVPRRITNVQARVKKLKAVPLVAEPMETKNAGPQWQSLDMLSMEAPSAKDPASASTSNRSSASSFSNQLSCPSCDSAMDQATHKCMALHPCNCVLCKSCSRSKTNQDGAIVCSLCNSLVEAVVVASPAEQQALADLPVRSTHTIAASLSRHSSPDRSAPQTGSLSAPGENKLQVLATRKYAKHKAACRGLEKRTAELLTRLAQLDLSLTSKADTGAEIKAQIDDVDRDMERLQTKKVRLCTRYEQHQHDQASLAAIIDNTKEELTLLKKDYAKSVKQLDTVKAQLQSYGCYDTAVREVNRSTSSSWSSISSISTTHSSSAALTHAETRALASPLLSRESSNTTIAPLAQARQSLSRGTLIGRADSLPAAPLPPLPTVETNRLKHGSSAGSTPPRPASQLINSVASKSTRSQHRRSVFVGEQPSASNLAPASSLTALPERSQAPSVATALASSTPSIPPTPAARAASAAALSSPPRRGVRIIMDDSDEESDADNADDDYEELTDIVPGDELDVSDQAVYSQLGRIRAQGLERQDSAVLQDAIGRNMTKAVQKSRSREALDLDVTLNASAIEQLYSDASEDEGEGQEQITMTAVELALAASAHMEDDDEGPDMSAADDMLLSFAGKGTIC